jgi:mRNA interferase HigB
MYPAGRWMRIISEKRLKQFGDAHPDARGPLRAWRQNVREARWRNFAELRAMYPSADQVEKCTVFNIGGNNYRLVAAIHYNRGVVYIRHVLTHAEYDRDKWKKECL